MFQFGNDIINVIMRQIKDPYKRMWCRHSRSDQNDTRQRRIGHKSDLIIRLNP